MAGAIRLSKAEREFVIKKLTVTETDREEKLRESILDKLDKSELVRGAGRAPGIGWQRAAAGMRMVLGPRLAVPTSPAIAWVMKMSNRIRDLGLTLADCTVIARVLEARGWKTYSFEKAIWEADRLLAEAQLEPTKSPVKTPKRPVDMEDI